MDGEKYVEKVFFVLNGNQVNLEMQSDAVSKWKTTGKSSFRLCALTFLVICLFSQLVPTNKKKEELV